MRLSVIRNNPEGNLHASAALPDPRNTPPWRICSNHDLPGGTHPATHAVWLIWRLIWRGSAVFSDTMADLEDTIADLATNPKRIKGDSGEVEEQSLEDVVDADRYLAGKEARRNNKRLVRFEKITGPGSTL